MGLELTSLKIRNQCITNIFLQYLWMLYFIQKCYCISIIVRRVRFFLYILQQISTFLKSSLCLLAYIVNSLALIACKLVRGNLSITDNALSAYLQGYELDCHGGHKTIFFFKIYGCFILLKISYCISIIVC